MFQLTYIVIYFVVTNGCNMLTTERNLFALRSLLQLRVYSGCGGSGLARERERERGDGNEKKTNIHLQK